MPVATTQEQLSELLAAQFDLGEHTLTQSETEAIVADLAGIDDPNEAEWFAAVRGQYPGVTRRPGHAFDNSDLNELLRSLLTAGVTETY
jgi:hypothetical protein